MKLNVKIKNVNALGIIKEKVIKNE